MIGAGGGPQGRTDGGGAVIALDPVALAAHPGAALVVDPAGKVIAANSRADALAAAVTAGRVASLAGLLDGTNPQGMALETLPGPGGGSQILELTAMPTANGRVLLLGRDVTLERNLRSALVESRQRYKDLVEISSDFAWEVGPDGRFVFVSPKGALGFPADELVGRQPGDFVIRQDGSLGAAIFAATLPLTDAEVWMRTADGGEACLLASATPMRAEDGGWAGVRGVCRDVTQERLRDSALVRANNRERLLSYVVRTIRDEVEPSDMLRAAAEATARAMGATGCQIFRILPDASDFALAAQFGGASDEHPVLDSFLGSDHYDGEIAGWNALATVTRYRHSINGALCLWRAPDRPQWGDDDRLLIDDVANQVGLANEQIANHERILRLSRTDSLTGLFNRRAFFEEMARRFQRLSHEQKPATLIYADLDNFKWVNDVHGHQVGDQALLALRDLLLQNTRPIDLVARLGGDEFAIWLEGGDERIALMRCNELMEATRSLKRFSGSGERPLHVSLGVAVHTGGSGETLDELVARADRAMYEVKREGKGSWRMAPPPEV